MIWIKSLMWIIVGVSMYHAIKLSDEECKACGFTVCQTMIHEIVNAVSVSVNKSA